MLLVEDVFIFSDWTSINQIPNNFDSRLKAHSSSIIKTCGGVKKTVGHEITVYRNSTIVYRFKVETDLPGEWSLSTLQAVEFLNSVGFRCKYVPPLSISLSKSLKEILRSLTNLGYSHVVRLFVEGKGKVIAFSFSNDKLRLDISNHESYNYQDWLFLRLDTPTLISSLTEECE